MKFVVEEVRVGKDNEFFVTMDKHKLFLTYLRATYPLPDKAEWVKGGMYWSQCTGYYRTFMVSEAVWKVVSADGHFKGMTVGAMPTTRYGWSLLDIRKVVLG